MYILKLHNIDTPPTPLLLSLFFGLVAIASSLLVHEVPSFHFVLSLLQDLSALFDKGLYPVVKKATVHNYPVRMTLLCSK
jgi:hypothetical protein